MKYSLLLCRRKKHRTMNNYQLKLVNSTYPVSDAKRVLLSLITDKIKSLNETIFSEEERFGSDTQHLRNRVKELKQERENLIVLFNQFRKDDHIVAIDCNIDFNIKTPEGVAAESVDQA